ncbi:hypothetical protein CDO44_07725 [Pigmentiphaga sp. NML080357]|uniref:YoaK family protein n=1 Tax=Pigmentiphaga sp. NML080357 TaxID=2008675 RepID=UPI000B421638|nr:hypothetical protein CDO44_07725 [Pigmentiphaga sp. NML080357]
MPLFYLRRLTSVERSPQANRHLAYYLAFVAGAVNAGGFLAVQQYTSHMSGILSSMADHLALGAVAVFLQGMAALLSFVLGAATSAMLINFGRRSRLASEFALPLLLEGLLLLCFGLLGGNLEQFRWLAVPATVMLLCYIMGLQNAIITKMSRAEIRTTHVTGMVTDIGIELGKLFYWNVSAAAEPGHFVRADRSKLKMLGMLVGLFFVGGVGGALSFSYFGFVSTVPLAVLLAVLAAMPVVDDLQGYWRHH